MLHAGKWRSGNPHVRFNHRPGTVVVTGRRPWRPAGPGVGFEVPRPPDVVKKADSPAAPKGSFKSERKTGQPFQDEDGNSLLKKVKAKRSARKARAALTFFIRSLSGDYERAGWGVAGLIRLPKIIIGIGF